MYLHRKLAPSEIMAEALRMSRDVVRIPVEGKTIRKIRRDGRIEVDARPFRTLAEMGPVKKDLSSLALRLADYVKEVGE